MDKKKESNYLFDQRWTWQKGKSFNPEIKQFMVTRYPDGFSVNPMEHCNSMGKSIYAETIEDVVHLMRKHFEC